MYISGLLWIHEQWIWPKTSKRITPISFNDHMCSPYYQILNKLFEKLVVTLYRVKNNVEVSCKGDLYITIKFVNALRSNLSLDTLVFL